jgi:hypothetical protein
LVPHFDNVQPKTMENLTQILPYIICHLILEELLLACSRYSWHMKRTCFEKYPLQTVTGLWKFMLCFTVYFYGHLSLPDSLANDLSTNPSTKLCFQTWCSNAKLYHAGGCGLENPPNPSGSNPIIFPWDKRPLNWRFVVV